MGIHTEMQQINEQNYSTNTELKFKTVKEVWRELEVFTGKNLQNKLKVLTFERRVRDLTKKMIMCIVQKLHEPYKE